MISSKNWFATWFDSPYYHQLYKHRNDAEAQVFVQNIVEHLQLSTGAKVLDLACGKGRHSIELNKNKLEVTGLDLSPNSIAYAQQYASSTLHFAVHDMRNFYTSNYFDAVLNLFTSFGYFSNIHDNVRVAKTIAQACKPGGKIIVDFMNATKILPTINKDDVSTVVIDEAITITHYKTIEQGCIRKYITVNDAGVIHNFAESVQALQLVDFKHIFKQANLTLVATYGNYSLKPYNAAESDRLILEFAKH